MALVMGGAGLGAMRQRRSIAAALDYVKALSRERGRTRWELAEARLVRRTAPDAGPAQEGTGGRGRNCGTRLRALAAQCLPDDPDDLIGPGIAIDETAHLKKGRATACVSPQHAGATGKGRRTA